MDHLNGATWRKAGRSTSNGGACVELLAVSRTVLVRDSKDPEGARLRFSSRGFRRFVEGVKGS